MDICTDSCDQTRVGKPNEHNGIGVSVQDSPESWVPSAREFPRGRRTFVWSSCAVSGALTSSGKDFLRLTVTTGAGEGAREDAEGPEGGFRGKGKGAAPHGGSGPSRRLCLVQLTGRVF